MARRHKPCPEGGPLSRREGTRVQTHILVHPEEAGARLTLPPPSNRRRVEGRASGPRGFKGSSGAPVVTPAVCRPLEGGSVSSAHTPADRPCLGPAAISPQLIYNHGGERNHFTICRCPEFQIPPGQKQSPARLSPHPGIFILPPQIQTIPEGKQKIQRTRPACLQDLHALHTLKICSLLMTDFPTSSISLFISVTLLHLQVSDHLSPCELPFWYLM